MRQLSSAHQSGQVSALVKRCSISHTGTIPPERYGVRDTADCEQHIYL